MLEGAISCDVDTLASIYKGYGLRRPGGYTYVEFRMGLENFCRFLQPFGIKATLFMVGMDFHQPQNIPYIKAVIAEGHEIANHTLTHAQGFQLLSPEAKEAEIAGMEEICQQVTGKRPVGFRAPGWNISDDALPILRRRGCLYDSSVFPTLLMPLLKFLHWRSMSSRSGGDRTTMGHLKYMMAPVTPYRTTQRSLAEKGQCGIIEFPITVTPVTRLPFFATFLLVTGLDLFRMCYQALKGLGRPIQFQFHLSDFVDYSHPELANQVPDSNGVYVPQALRTPLRKKWDLFQRALSLIAEDYTFSTLASWAKKFS
jgi:predicted deacetylase